MTENEKKSKELYEKGRKLNEEGRKLLAESRKIRFGAQTILKDIEELKRKNKRENERANELFESGTFR